MSRDGTTLVYETSSACSYLPNSTHLHTQLVLSIWFGISCLKINLNTYWQILENSSRNFSEISVFWAMAQTVSLTKSSNFFSKFHFSRPFYLSMDELSNNTVCVTSRKLWNSIFRLNSLFWMSFPVIKFWMSFPILSFGWVFQFTIWLMSRISPIRVKWVCLMWFQDLRAFPSLIV